MAVVLNGPDEPCADLVVAGAGKADRRDDEPEAEGNQGHRGDPLDQPGVPTLLRRGLRQDAGAEGLVDGGHDTLLSRQSGWRPR